MAGTAAAVTCGDAGIEWEDVDLDGATLAVRRQRVQLGWEVIEDEPKSDVDERTVALDAGTVEILGHSSITLTSDTYTKRVSGRGRRRCRGARAEGGRH